MADKSIRRGTLKPHRMVFLRKTHKTRCLWPSGRGFRTVSGEVIRKGRLSLLPRLLQSYRPCQSKNEGIVEQGEFCWRLLFECTFELEESNQNQKQVALVFIPI
jgi:hypothetical protein